MELLQEITLLGSGRILRKVLNTNLYWGKLIVTFILLNKELTRSSWG